MEDIYHQKESHFCTELCRAKPNQWKGTQLPHTFFKCIDNCVLKMAYAEEARIKYALEVSQFAYKGQS